MTGVVPLPRGHRALVDDEDLEFVLAHRWNFDVPPTTGSWRVYRAWRDPVSGSTKRTYLHRHILERHGVDLEDKVRHRNRDGLDNRKSNLQVLTVHERFYSRLKPEGDCLVWTGARTGKQDNPKELQYGVFYFEGSQQLTHRVALKLAGVEVPDDLLVCHTCDHPPCCDPEHLYVGTFSDNRRDQLERGSPRPRPTHCIRGHEFTWDNTYWRAPDFKHRTCRTCNAMWGRLRKAV